MGNGELHYSIHTDVHVIGVHVTDARDARVTDVCVSLMCMLLMCTLLSYTSSISYTYIIITRESENNDYYS